jgi:hypothetical protein
LQIDKYNDRVTLNRQILERLINCTIFLAKQEMAFRGHNETKDSQNRGAFKELLRF